MASHAPTSYVCPFCLLVTGVENEQVLSHQSDIVYKDAVVTAFIGAKQWPYTPGHVLIVPYLHVDSLATLPAAAAEEMIRTAQRLETTLHKVYTPDGINIGMNLGQAAGAGVAGHIHMHQLPRWYGDTNFMTVTAETRVLPETLEVTLERLRYNF